MARKQNKTVDGYHFTHDRVEAVWQKATSCGLLDLAGFWGSVGGRKRDSFGRLIDRAAYGTTEQFGWEIDHIQPVSLGGSDELTNLQPLHWENNRKKGDDPFWSGYSGGLLGSV